MTQSVHIPALEQLLTAPEAIATRDHRGASTWLEFFTGVQAQVLAMQSAGLRSGDHAALLMENRREYFEVLLAAVFSGVWLTPVNRHLTAPEIDYVLEDSGAQLLLLGDEPERPDWAIATVDVSTLAPDSAAQAEALYREFTAWLARSPGGTMMYTSGTTGRPKGVQRAGLATVGQTLESWCKLATGIGLDGQGVHLVTGPAYHAAPGLYALYDLINGASLTVMPRWDDEACVALIERDCVTHTHLVPTMFVRLLRARSAFTRDYDLSSLRLVLHGAAPVSVPVKQQMIEWWGPVIEEYWGASESGIITRVNSDDWRAHPGTVGRPLAQYELQVWDEQGEPVPTGEVGMLYARRLGVQRPFVYFKDADKTEQCYRGEWFTLGDLGWLDEQGFAYIADRRSNLIISGGVNIYPAEVEGALCAHPEVVDAVVVGLDDAEWGKRVHAIVQGVPGVNAQLLEQSLREHLSEQLAAFKCPRSYEFSAQLPRFDSGKLYRARL